MLDDLDHSLLAIRGVAASRMGEVTIACVPSTVYYFLSHVIRHYHERFPKVRIKVLDASANHVLSAVASGEVDFGLNFIGAIVSVPLDEPGVTRQVGLIRRRGWSFSPSAQQLYDFLIGMKPMVAVRRSKA